MPTLLSSRSSSAGLQRDWRCRRCDKLLGRILADRVHLRFARQHEYHAALPASCTCRGCGALNELHYPGPTRAA